MMTKIVKIGLVTYRVNDLKQYKELLERKLNTQNGVSDFQDYKNTVDELAELSNNQQ